MNKITIIGAGFVGSTTAYSLAVMGIANEIVLIDINKDKAIGEAMDIRQGTPFCNPCDIYAGDYPDAKNSDIVILTSGIARKPGQSRLELSKTNVEITKSIIPEITKYAPDAIYIIVSNPVDILTYTFIKYSGIPENHIIGSGTILDTSRLRTRLAEIYNVSQSNVHAYVFGEHGDSSFVPWSICNISNVPISECQSIYANSEEPLDRAAIEEHVRNSGGFIIAKKGATFQAVSTATCYICKCILRGIDTTMAVSTMMRGEYGINDVCLSTLNSIGRNGVSGKVNIRLTDDEVIKLRHSAQVLKEVEKSLNI